MNGAFRSGLGALAMLLVISPSARGTNHLVRIDEVLGGCGDSRAAQFVELAFFQGQNLWAGCARLEFRDAEGRLVGSFDFTTNPPDPFPENSVLVGTADFARLPGAPTPDFLMPPFVVAPAGEVCLRDTGRPECFPVSQCVAYGNVPGQVGRAPVLPPDGAVSLQRVRFDGTHDDFAPRTPSPRNGTGVSGGFRCTNTSLVEEGERLFFEETFAGNGRTCGTCHPSAHAFTIDPSLVATLPRSDPLFVAELSAALAGLERPPLLRGPRTLILENVDGFDRAPVFRGTPHLLNVGRTAPYGLGGDVPDLRTFSAMAVRQHFPRSLARVSSVDFREPTDEELAALEAFMQTIVEGNPEGVNPWSLALRPAASRGRDLFFGAAKCAFCHSGPFLSFPWTTPDFAFKFDTGVTRQPVNLVPPPECPACPPIGPLEGGRAFDVPALVGVRDTAPFFHDNSAPTLHDAVAFYGSRSFNESPAAEIVGPIALNLGDIDDVVAFLEGLTGCGNGILDGDEACDDGNAADGDCCSATCEATAADGTPCDDGNACTRSTQCRTGACVAVEADVCGGRACTASDALTPAVVTCAVAPLIGDVPRCPTPSVRLRRKIDRGVELVESALGDGVSPRASKALGKAARAFGRAARIASRAPVRGCDIDVASAAGEAKSRSLCVRECVGRRSTGR